MGVTDEWGQLLFGDAALNKSNFTFQEETGNEATPKAGTEKMLFCYSCA